LGMDRPIFALQHQSEDGQRALYTEVEKIAAHYREEIRAVQPQGPYLLCGYSFGGVIAFEIAQQLKRDHQEVGMLALIDTLSLGQRNSQFDLLSSWDLRRARYFLAFTKTREWLVKHASLSRREIVRKALDEVPRLVKNFASDRIGKFSGWLKRTVGRIYANMGYAIPAKLRSAYILDIYRKAAQAYSPCIYPGRVIYFKSHMNCSDPRLSWGNLVEGEFTVYEIPGNHMDLREGPFVEAWASIIKHELDEFSANQSVVEPVVNPPAWPSQSARYEPTHA
jgi:thioesterase domain-containing protein